MSKINRRPVRRTAAGILASTLMLSGVVAAATPATAAAGFNFDRLSGNDRYETSAAIAARFGAATSVILASGEAGRTPDALAANFLAGVQNAPVLVTRRDTTPEPILTALRALRTGGATTITVVGGPAAISDVQLTALRALGFTVNRVSGADRYQTAAAVAAAGEGATASNVGLVASGVSTIDALAGGPLSWKGKHPLFLTTRGGLPAASINGMRAAGVTSVYILGGEAVVGPQVAAQLSAAGITVAGRLAGADRSATSVAIANALVTNFGFTNTTFNLASGLNEGVDALSGASLSGKENRALLITNNATSAAPVLAFAAAQRATLTAAGHIFGGETVVSNALSQSIVQAGGGVGTGTGPITLTNTTAAQGGSFTGTIANPETVQSVSLTGCGFTNQAVTVSAAGGFTQSIPAAQTAGACTLTFSVLRTNGTTETSTASFTVTAAPSSTTAAPDLVSATANTTSGVVTYTFDQNVTGVAPVAADFYLYDATGARIESSTTQAPQVSGSTVLVQFTAAEATRATLAAAGDDAVQDAAGRSSYAASAPLGAQTQAAGITDAPDLQSVTNLRVQNALIVADFRFDEQIDATATDPTDFELIASDGTVYTGTGAVVATSADLRTVTISFGGTTTVPIGSIVRGVVNPGAVEDTATTANVNVLQTEPRTGTPAFTGGVVADRTDDPDITGAVVAGTNVVAVTFDEPVSATAVFGNFFIYDADGNAIAATGAARSSADTSVVNVTFAGGVTPTVGAAVGVAADAGAVTAIDDNAPNQAHELGLQALTNSAGRTAIPDLVSVRITVNAFGQNSVVYTFDQTPTVVAAANFGLVDPNGTIFTPAGNGTIDGNTITFTGASAFTNAQAAAAVIGNVEDLTTGAADLTTGDVAVQR